MKIMANRFSRKRCPYCKTKGNIFSIDGDYLGNDWYCKACGNTS